MGRALEIDVRVIPSKLANPFVKRVHYSGKVVNNSTLHFGVFLDGALHGAMSFGNPTDKSKVLGLVEGTPWNGMLELNRMAFDDYLPRNSESRAISIAMKLIKRNAPHIKWVLSFADGCQSGDGTIYRASNFILTQIKENTSLIRFPDGSVIHSLTLTNDKTRKFEVLGGNSVMELNRRGGLHKYLESIGAEYVAGFQLRYIYFIDPRWRKRLTVPEIPFSEIDRMGAGMYKGERVTQSERHVGR